MGVVTHNLILPLFPLLNYTLSDCQSQAFNPQKKGDFF